MIYHRVCHLPYNKGRYIVYMFTIHINGCLIYQTLLNFIDLHLWQYPQQKKEERRKKGRKKSDISLCAINLVSFCQTVIVVYVRVTIIRSWNANWCLKLLSFWFINHNVITSSFIYLPYDHLWFIIKYVVLVKKGKLDV